jgi:hypothetical protein
LATSPSASPELANYLRIEEATHTRRRDDPEIAAKLRIEERELEAGGLT